MLLWLQLTWQHQTQGCGAGSGALQIPTLLFPWNTNELGSVLPGSAPKGPGRWLLLLQPAIGASGAASGRIHAANRSRRSHKNGMFVPCPCQQPEPLESFPAEELAPGGAASPQPYKHRSAITSPTSPGSQCLPPAAPYNRFHGFPEHHTTLCSSLWLGDGCSLPEPSQLSHPVHMDPTQGMENTPGAPAMEHHTRTQPPGAAAPLPVP